MVFESVVADLLNKFLGDYVENLDNKQLKIGIWGGDVVLTDLYIRENALDELDLPFQLAFGHLGKLVLKIPWKNLYSQPVVAEVEDLYILITSKQSVRYDEEKEAKYEMQAKQSALQNLENLRKFQEEKQKVKGDPSFTERLTAQIVNNLQVKIANIHIRFEDSTTLNHTFAFGITLHELELFTTDSSWNKNYMTEQLSKVFKVANLNSLASYMNCNARSFMQYDVSEFSHLFKSNIAHKGYLPNNFTYILAPISVNTKLQLNMNPEKDQPPFIVPKVDLNLEIDTLKVAITKAQFQDVITIGDNVNRLRMGIPYRKYRPFGISYKGHSKEWWKFAITAVLEENVRKKLSYWSWKHILDHRKLCRTYTEAFKEKLLSKKPATNTLENIEMCETKLDVFNLILIRNKVYLEVDLIKREEEKKHANKGGWFSGWFGAAKADESNFNIVTQIDAAMTVDEKAKLYEAIGYQENATELTFPEGYIAIKMRFLLSSLEIYVYDEIFRESNTKHTAQDIIGTQSIIDMSLSLVLCEIYQLPATNSLTVKVGVKNLLLTGYKKDDFVPTIINSEIQEDENLLEIMFESNPLDKKCDQRVKAFAKRLQVVFDSNTVIQLAEVFTPPSSVNVKDLAPAVPLKDVKQRSALGYQYLVDKHPVIEVDIKFLPTIIIIPHSGVYHPQTSSVVVISLGELTVVSVPHATNAQDVKAMFQGGQGQEYILKEMMSRTYDRYEISVEHIQVLVAKGGENWINVINRGQMSEMHVLCPSDLSVSLKLCLISDDYRLPKTKVKVMLPSLKINVIEERIFEALNIGLSIPLPQKDLSEEGTLVKAASFAVSSMSLKKLLDSENERVFKRMRSEAPEITDEIVQLTDLTAKFTLKEFVVTLYREQKEETDSTSSDQFETPIEEFSNESFSSEDFFAPVGHEKLISFKIIQLGAEFFQRTYEMAASVKLGAIVLDQFSPIDGVLQKITIINTPLYQENVQYLLTIDYTNANKDAPEFKTKYNSIEQLINVRFSSLIIVLHQECLQIILKIGNGLQLKLAEVQAAQPKRDHYVSADDSLIHREIKHALEAIPEEGEKVIKKSEKGRRKQKVVDSIKVKLITNLEQVAVQITCRKRDIANLKVQNFNAGIIMKTSYTEISLKLKDILVTDLNPHTMHQKVLSIVGENALNCQVVMFNLEETSNYNSDDIKIEVTMGCVKIVFLNWFISSCLNFLGHFQAAQEAIATAGAAAAGAAKQNVVDAYEKATRLKFHVKIKAPLIIVPVNSKSLDGIALDLGFLSITNVTNEINSDNIDKGLAILDEIKLELKDLKLSRVTIDSSQAIEQTKTDSSLIYGIASHANIFDPISFILNVTRNLSYNWFKEKPELDVSGRIKSIELNVYLEDYLLLMNILNDNLTEGIDEFPQPSIEDKINMGIPAAEVSTLAKIEVHQGYRDDSSTEGAKSRNNSKELSKETLELQNEMDKDTGVALRFNFQLDGVVINLIEANKDGLASFGLYVLSVKGKRLVDGTLSLSLVLCDMQLDDIRPGSQLQITKYLRRRENKAKPTVKEENKNMPYMVDVVSIIKGKETFAELRVCAFDLIICIDFLMQIAKFVVVPEETTVKEVSQSTQPLAKMENKIVTKPKKKVAPVDPDLKISLILHLEEPDIILVESLEDFNTHAIIFNSEVNLKFRQIGEKQLIYGDIKDLKMYMCNFMEEQRESTKHFIIHPCTLTLHGSTPENKGLHLNIKSSDIIINISPGTIELINKAIVTVMGNAEQKKQQIQESPNYNNIWAIKDFEEHEFWFMRVEEAAEAIDLPDNITVEYKPEMCILEVPLLLLVLESGVGYYTTPLLTLETKLDTMIYDWSQKMKVDGSLTLTMYHYNNALAVWEPLIEPNERLGKKSGILTHSPWEMNFEVRTEQKISEDDFDMDESVTKIKMFSADILEVTLSKTGYNLLMDMSNAFSQAFESEGLTKPEIVAPYVLENDTGFELEIDFTKGILTLHDYHIPSLNPKYTEGVNKALVFQAMDEELNLRADDIKSCTVSANGKVYLKKKTVTTSMEAPSSTMAMSEEDALVQFEYIYIQVGGIQKQISIPISRADERYFPLYRDTNQEPWGIISEVSIEYGTTKINIHGVVKIRNHFTTPISIYRLRTDKTHFIGEVSPGEEFHVPLHAIYAVHKELYFSLPGYKRSVQGIKWNENLTDLSYMRHIQCDPISTFETFYINALREKTEVYYEVTSKCTLLSASYTIHLRPPLYLQNSLPINIKVSVAGCSVQQDGGIPKGIEMESSIRGTIREDYLDYGEKEVNPGDILHLPTVKLTTKFGEAKSYVVIRMVQYLEKDWSCTTEISENYEEYSIWTFSSYDSVAKMDLDFGVKFEKRHGSLMLILYCPFWMLNKTGLTLSYRTNLETVNILYHPPVYSGPILFSFRDKYFFGKKRASIRVDSGEWSEKIPLDVAGSTGSVECNANDTVYRIGVHNHLTHNSLTKIITFIPFYMVVNKAYFTIEIQETYRPGDPWLEIKSGDWVPLWPKVDTNHILHVRIPGENHVSPPFNYTEVQCSLLRMKNQYGGVNVDVHATEGGIVITFSEYHPGDAPGLIINHTSKKISFWEKGNVNERVLNPMQKRLFAWSNVAGDRKILWDDGKDQILNDLRRDGVGHVRFGPSEQDVAYWVSFLDGLQRVLLFTEKSSVINQAESNTNLAKETQEIEVSIHGIGLSIINNIKGTDILYLGVTSSGIIWETRRTGKQRFKQMKIAQNAMIEHQYQQYLNDQQAGIINNEYFLEGEKFRIDFTEMKLKKSPERDIRRTFYPGIWLYLKTSAFETQLHAKINRLQIDNQLLDCIFPVILAPIPPPKSVAAETSLKPFVECSIVQRVVPHSVVKQFKYASVLIQEFHVKVDLQLITDIFEIFATATNDEEAAKLFKEDLRSIAISLSDMVARQSMQEQKNFYDNLHLGPLKIHVSFTMAGSDISALPGILSTILQSVGVTLTDVNDVVFRLAFFEREYQFLTHGQLISEISAHYIGQFLKQAYVLVLGLDVLGNPFGLVVGLSKGVEDLFYEPFQGAIQGPGEFAEGLALGVKSLFGHAVGGAAGAVSKITGAMGKGIAALTFDKDYQRKRRQAMHKTPTNFQEGIARSSKGLIMGVVDGVTGVFTKPISGAKQQGVEGFFKGLGKGAVGLVARPTAGVVDFASGTLETVKRATDNSEEVTRIRAPRFLYADGIVRPYTKSEADGNKIFREIEKGRFVKTDVFNYYEQIVEKQEVIVVTNHRIIYVTKNDLFGNWVIQWTYRWPEITMIRSVDRGVEITLKKDERKILGLFAAGDVQRKILPIAEKERRQNLAIRMEKIRQHHD